MQPIKTVYYQDPLKDEFSGTKIERLPLGKFVYAPKNVFWNIGSFLVYWFVFPLIWIFTRFLFVRVKGKKNRKGLRKTGVVVYGNHTQILDAFSGQMFATPGKRTYIVCNQDTTSIKGVRWLVHMMGAIPTPENPAEAAQYHDCMVKRLKQKASITIFPEAHIWPYYTHIRPFGDESFTFPAEVGAPVMAMVTTYRPRKVFKNKAPLPTIHLSKPFYPDMSLSLPERRKQLRDYVYEFMVRKTAEETNVEWIRYVKKPD